MRLFSDEFNIEILLSVIVRQKKSWKIIFIDYFFSLLRICHARGIWADEYLGIKWPTI